MRVLLVEDDIRVGAAAKAALKQHGMACDWVKSALEFRPALQDHRYDCILLDLMLQDGSGAELLAELRQGGSSVPVIVVTAQQQGETSSELLDSGADDYVVKPYDIADLTARIRAVMRRVRSEVARVALKHGPLTLLADRRIALWHDAVVPLRAKEYWLLETLLRNRQRVHTRRQLEEALYGWGEETGSNTIEVFIHHVRRRFCSELIVTERGLGYRLGDEDVLALLPPPPRVPAALASSAG